MADVSASRQFEPKRHALQGFTVVCKAGGRTTDARTMMTYGGALLSETSVCPMLARALKL